MSDITVEVTQSDIAANVTSPNISATVTSADIAANVTTTDVTANVEAANVTVNITGGGSPHIIQDEGTAVTQRANLNFVGSSVAVTDDSANNATVVTISGGGTWGSITGTLSNQTDLQTALDGKVDENAAITGATKTKITYDTKGLVTAGADAAIADITGLQTALDGKSNTGHTHPLSDITQSSATLNQVPKWNGSAWVPADEAGGGAGVTSITYADMATAIAGSTLTPGGWYLITDATGTDLGFLTYAVNENTISVQGVGGYLNADFQAVGDYSGVEAETGVAAGNQLGIWRTGFEEITITYTNLSGGTFAVGDTITGQNTGSTAVIVSDDGVSSMTAYMTSAGVAFDGSEVLDNGSGVTADMDGAAGSPTIVLGDAVIWNLLHYQLTDATLLDGTDPETNTTAYTLLDKATYPETYITAWDSSEFDFPNEWLQYRQDNQDNAIRYSKLTDDYDLDLGYSALLDFQFGNPLHLNNKVSGGYVNLKNSLCQLFYNNLYAGCKIYNCEFAIGVQVGYTYMMPNSVITEISCGENTAILNNVLENSAQLTGITAGANCSISRNKIGQGATLGGSTTLSDNASINENEIGPNATIGNITAAEYCSISRNKIGQGATLGGSTTLSDNASINENEIGPNATIGNITAAEFGNITGNYVGANGYLYDIDLQQLSSVSATKLGVGAELSGITLESSGIGAQVIACELFSGVQVAGKTIQDAILVQDVYFGIGANETETISTTIDANRSVSGFSNVPATIDITGLTTLDCTAAFAQYRGIYNLTSSNATEAIDTITNPPTLFPFTIRPEAGITLTITGTAYAGIGAGQIALKATDYTLDGDKGEYIVLEIDPLGTGALIEKYVGNGLI